MNPDRFRRIDDMPPDCTKERWSDVLDRYGEAVQLVDCGIMPAVVIEGALRAAGVTSDE